VATNVAFLSRVVAHDAFAHGKLDTGLIARHRDELFAPPQPVSDRALIALALAETLALEARRLQEAAASGDAHSPWHRVDPWWPNSASHALAYTFAQGEALDEVAVRRVEGGHRMALRGSDVIVHANARDRRLAIVTPSGEFTASVVAIGDERHVFTGGEHRRLTLVDPLAHAGEEEVHGGHLTAPMSGTVVAVMVKAGETVAKGAPLIVLEAMKMEHTITAPSAGVVSAVNFTVGERVGEGADLVDIND
jgi:3-methylcrotonyl-CoA carboxylase alpha subunit